jgi:hypothetical protein
MALLSAAICLLVADERNRILLGGWTQLERGEEVLGITFGTPIETAERVLTASGFEATDFAQRHPDFMESCSGDAATGQVMIYRDRGWRNGFACVESLDGRVAAMHVSYAPIEI